MSPESFEQSLKNYDGRLSLRWGNAAKCWIIERKGRVSVGEMELLIYANKFPRPDEKAVEELISAKASKHVIFYVSALDRRVFDALSLRDMRKYGDKTLKHIREEIPAAKQRAERNRSNDLAREAVSIMHWMSEKHSTDIQHGACG